MSLHQPSEHRAKETQQTPPDVPPTAAGVERVEWDFEAVPIEELFCCSLWEYARESARIRAAYDAGGSTFFPDPEPAELAKKASQHIRTPLTLDPARADFITLLREYALPVFVTCSQTARTGLVPRFDSPWQSLPEPIRQATVAELAPFLAEHPALTFLPFNRCPDMRDVGLADAAYRCAEFDAENGLERLRVQIDWAAFTDAQITRAFKLWLSENRPPGVEKSDDRGRRKAKGFSNQLAWLAMMRLMSVHPYTSIEAELPEAWSLYRSADWPRARQKALAVFREFFPFLPAEDFPLHWPTAGNRAW